jgi:DNA-directed RNA polymerase specialized sigma24 family protein
MEEPLDFEAFCLRNNTALIRLLTLYCGNRETARDLAQETLARTWLNWRKVRRLDRPDLWARRVALNLANSHFRHARVERARGHLLVDQPASSGPDVGERMLIERVLGGLTERQRAAVLLVTGHLRLIAAWRRHFVTLSSALLGSRCPLERDASGATSLTTTARLTPMPHPHRGR